jgi:VWFA-related protein
LLRIAALFAVLTPLAAAQSGRAIQSSPAESVPAAAETTSADAESRSVRIEAIVTDKQGRPVVNLRPSDFEVYENGVAQKIDSAELTSRPASSTRDAKPDAANDVSGKEEEERAAREPGTRVIALYLDEFHVSAGASTERVRYAASRFVDEWLRPDDLVVVMRPLDHVTNIRFTRDRDVARKTIAGFGGRKDDYTPRTPFEEQYMSRSPGAVRAARSQIVMSGLRALAARMGELDGGLASIVLISEGFNADLPRSRERRLADPHGFARTTARSRILFYAFDASPQPGADAGAADGALPAPSMAALQTIARQTGGEALAAGGDLVSALGRVSKDLDSYYVLTYKTSQAPDGRFHDLRVTTNRRDAQVRTKSGFWTTFPSMLRTAARTPAPAIVPMRAVRRSPLIQSWIGMTIEPDKRRRVIFTWTPAAEPTRITKPLARPDLVTLKVTTPAGNVLFDGDVLPARGAAVSGERANRATFLTGPGRLQFDLTISKADGTKLDVGAQDFDVPEVRPGNPLILPPQFFRAASAREFRELSADAAAAPLPGRDFRRTDHVLLRVPTYDPSGGTVRVSAKLMNRVGAVLAELVATAEDGSAISQFDLSLARFAPGEYSIEIAAQSATGLARELIRVRITG